MSRTLQDSLAQLRNTLGKMEVALGSIDDSIVWTNGKGEIEWCNRAFDRLIGLAHIEILGRPVEDVLPLEADGDPLPRTAYPVHLAINRRRNVDGLYQMRESSRRLWITSRFLTLAENHLHVVMKIQDIIEIKELEPVHLQSVAFQAAANAIVIADREGRILRVNRAFTQLSGYGPEEVYDQDFRILESGENAPALHRDIWDTILSGESWSGRLTNRKKDGTEYLEWQTITPVANQEGEVTHFIAIKQDITEREKTRRELQESETRLQNVLDTAVDAIIVIDHRGAIQSVNPAVQRLFGYSPSELLNKNVSILMPEPDRSRHDDYIERYIRTGITKIIGIGRETTALRKDGGQFPIDLTISELWIEGQRFFTGILRDITERKKAEEVLVRAREQEIEIGSRIQQTLLLGHPPQSIEGVEFSSLSVASERIAGDFHDYLVSDDHTFDVLLGDVMGKGIAAALLGAATKNQFFRVFGGTGLRDDGELRLEPHEIVNRVHKIITGELVELGSFVTLCYARFDVRSGSLTFVDCGHTRIIHYRAADRSCHLLQGVNLPLGFYEKEEYVQAVQSFEEGDCFLFYSDGVTEAFNRDREAFGEDRLVQTTVENGHRSADELIRAVQLATSSFVGSTSLSDDLTCLAVKVTKDRRTSFGACWELKLESRLHELERLRTFLLDLSRQSDRPELVDEALPHIQLAAQEALTNIIKHAYAGEPSGSIHVKAELSREKIAVTLSHYGEGFDPEGVPEPSFDGSRESGFGLYIIRESMDEVEFFDEPQGRKVVRLVKYLDKSS